MSWLRDMSGDAIPPSGLAEWAATQPTLASAWRQCPRPDWQLWLAAHLPGRTNRDERAIIGVGLSLFAEPSFIVDILKYMWPFPTERDALDAWSHDATSKLTLEQRLIAGGSAFAIALLFGIAIDRVWGVRFGVGFGRTVWQNILTIALLLPLTPALRAYRRSRFQRTAGRWTFADAFDRVWTRVHARAESASDTDCCELAKTARLDMYGVTSRHFPWPHT